MMPIMVMKSLPILDRQTVTVGGGGIAPSRFRGYVSGSYGAIADSTSDIYGGAVIDQLFWDEVTGLVTWKILGIVSNSGWTTVNINGNLLNRAAATFSIPGSDSQWTWTASNPFGFAIGPSVSAIWS